MLPLRIRGRHADDPSLRPRPVPGTVEVSCPLIPDGVGWSLRERAGQLRRPARQPVVQRSSAAELLFEFEVGWSRARHPGRPRISKELQGLIARIATENPRWGAVRIQGELLALGYEVSAETVRCYRRRAQRPPPSQSWRTFLANHARSSGLRTSSPCRRSPSRRCTVRPPGFHLRLDEHEVGRRALVERDEQVDVHLVRVEVPLAYTAN